MKKRIFTITVGLIIVLGIWMNAFSGERAIVKDMSFVGDPVKLSLSQAVEIMQTTGSRAETAKLNMAADEAVAKGYNESVQSMADFFKGLKDLKLAEQSGMAPAGSSFILSSESESMGMTEINEKIMKKRRDFAKGQIEANHEAELNEIETMTVSVYYGILLAEENLKVTKENLENQKAIYENTLKKFKQGTVAKIDTLIAETQVALADDQVRQAESSLNNAKMSFNMLLGHDLMQQVYLTDELLMLEEPKGSLTEFIESALDKRNEIKGAALAYEIQEILLKNLEFRYPKNSSTYLKQEAAALQAKKAYEDVPIQVEYDIRSRYMDVLDKKRGIDVALANMNNAKEGARLSLISYDAGINTLTDVEEAQIASFQAHLGVAAATTDYNLAVHDFYHAIGVGTMRLPL